MENKHRRILWLLNHTTLREFEVPLLQKLGFEVFVPKILPNNDANGSDSITYEHDKSLSISAQELAILNTINFYDGIYSNETLDILNQKFNIVIFGFFPQMFEALIKNFQGKLLLRVFGLAGEARYEDIISAILGRRFLSAIKKIAQRFWVAQAYDEISHNERNIFKTRSVTLPLGLPQANDVNKTQWQGDLNQIFFVCPRINSSPAYYGKIYQQFKKEFSNFPYVICGAQPIAVTDPNVQGFLTRQKYDELMQKCKVMFYHSQEPRHLHYHPLEAITIGMPLIYMKGGMLESLGGKQQPGLCSNFAEARQKIRRVLKNDQPFIKHLLTTQVKLLDKFDAKYCHQQWEEKFLPLLSKDTISIPIKKRLAVILPETYKGGTLTALINTVCQLQKGAEQSGEPLEIVVYCVRNFYNLEDDFSAIYGKQNIKIREFNFVDCSKQEAEIMMEMTQSYEPMTESPQYLLIHDHYKGAIDCDFWLFISDRVRAPIVPLRPYAVIVYDYIQRYIPEMYGSWYEHACIELARQARLVIATTVQTQLDIRNYAGVNPAKIVCSEIQYDPDPILNIATLPSEEITKLINTIKNYCIWPTNVALHKNIDRTLNAINIYLQQGGKYKFIITGVDTDKFNPTNNSDANPRLDRIHQNIKQNKLLSDNLLFMGNLPQVDFLWVLKNAKFLLHPTLIDNGTFSVIEAAAFGIPSASAHYLQMQYIDNEFKLNMQFFDPSNEESISKVLHHMENNYLQQANKLPSLELLRNKCYSVNTEWLWKTIRSALC